MCDCPTQWGTHQQAVGWNICQGHWNLMARPSITRWDWRHLPGCTWAIASQQNYPRQVTAPPHFLASITPPRMKHQCTLNLKPFPRPHRFCHLHCRFHPSRSSFLSSFLTFLAALRAEFGSACYPAIVPLAVTLTRPANLDIEPLELGPFPCPSGFPCLRCS